LAACCNGHVAPNEKGEPAEHPLFAQIRLAGDQFAYAIREFLVIGHGVDRTARRPRRAIAGFGVSAATSNQNADGSG
jgi:hypothetical protein